MRPSTEASRGAVGLPPCLYCGALDYAPRHENVEDRLGHVPGRWSFWTCQECGSATLAPFPAAADLAAFYPSVYSFSTELGQQSAIRRLMAWLEFRFYFGPQYEAQTRRVLRRVHWTGVRGLRLLDVGCGRGLRLLTFRRRGFEVYGTDFQQEVVDDLRERLSIPAVCTDVEGLAGAFPPASFDLITMFFVLEHVPSIDRALRACLTLLKPGGWFVGAVPFIDCVQAPLFGARWIHVTEAPRHLSLPTRDGMTRACRRAGFERVELAPDSALNCAGQVGSSLLPGAAITHVYGGARWRPVLRRLAGGVVTGLAIPFCLVENYLLGRPSLGMVIARKPERASQARC